MIKLSLFTGIYGDDIASEWAGIKTVCCVEKDKYCQQVIRKLRPDMPIIERIEDVTKEKIKEVSGYCAIDIIAGGFPCQPISNAGQRRGEADDRYLWPEMFRVIKELMPTWVLAENVYGLVSIQQGDLLDKMYADLESQDYETLPPVILPACGVNAPHRRYRVFIVAHSIRSSLGTGRERMGRQTGTDTDRRCERTDVADSQGYGRRPQFTEGSSQSLQENREDESEGSSRFIPDAKKLSERSGLCPCSQGEKWGGRLGHLGNVSNANGERQQKQCRSESIYKGSGRQESQRGDWWAIEPDVGRVAHGIPHRVDRLRALGNAVVPQQAYPFYKAIVSMGERIS